MKLPLLGPVSVTGFQNAWFFLFLLLVLLVIGVYVALQFARRRRVLRFANMEVLERVAPAHSGRWRHVPTILLAAALVLLTTAMAGPTSDGTGHSPRRERDRIAGRARSRPAWRVRTCARH